MRYGTEAGKENASKGVLVMNRIILGNGDVLISMAVQDNKPIIIFERGMGTGVIGDIHHDRPKGKVLQADEVDKATFVIEFGNEKAFSVLKDAIFNAEKFYELER